VLSGFPISSKSETRRSFYGISNRAALIFILLFCQLLIFVSHGFANDKCPDGVVRSPNTSSPLRIGTCSEWIFDPDSKWNVNQVLSGQAGSFLRSTTVAPNLGFQDGRFWLRFRIRNDSSSVQKLYLSLGNPLVDVAKIYRLESRGNIVELGSGGVLVPGQQKQVVDRDVTFSLLIPAQSESQFVVQATAIQQSYLPTLRNADGFQQHQLLEYLAFGLYFGVIVVMALYNLILFFVVRDRTYLWYVGSITFFHGFCFVGLLGATNHFFWSESPLWAQRQLSASAPLGLFFTILFADSFLKISDQSVPFARAMKILLAMVLLQFFISAAWFDVSVVKVGFVVQVGALFLVLSAALPNAIKGSRSAQLFLLAWACLIAGGLAFSFAQFGFYPHSFLTQNGILFGSAAEVVLLSFALGDKINAMRDEKELAQQKAIESANQRAMIESELLAANAVQETLLPPRDMSPGVDIATYYMVAERVGGDWYWHTHDVKNKVFYFYIGDVTGHGVPSALLTGVICGAVASMETEYAASDISVDPSARLLHTAEVINDVVRKTGARSDRWVSMCLIALDEKTGKLTTVNAGHPFPMIWRSGKGLLESLVSSGPLMGKSGASFTFKEDFLESGDFVMVYTDGYNEARERLKPAEHSSRRRELIGLFKKSGSPEQFVETVRSELNSLTVDGNTLTDDITIVLFRWRQTEELQGLLPEGGAA
jgi:serine phosphatase RsbU (regulator of sigma subunit)